jgi:hypothetical protein
MVELSEDSGMKLGGRGDMQAVDEDANPALDAGQADELPSLSLQMISTMCGA